MVSGGGGGGDARGVNETVSTQICLFYPISVVFRQI